MKKIAEEIIEFWGVPFLIGYAVWVAAVLAAASLPYWGPIVF
jgi:hypothetical protein